MTCCKICCEETPCVQTPCCPRENVCSSCILTWTTQEKRPACPMCGSLWSVFDAERMLGDKSVPVVEAFTKSLIETMAPFVSGQVGAYKRCKKDAERYRELKRKVETLTNTLTLSTEKNRVDLEMLLKNLIPPIEVPSLKRPVTDDPLDSLASVSDHMQRAYELYSPRLNAMCGAYYEMLKRGLLDRKTYGKAIAVLYLEHELLEMSSYAISAYLAEPDNKRVFKTLMKVVSIIKVAPEKLITRVKWWAFTETVNQINQTRFPEEMFVLTPADPPETAPCLSCGLVRERSQWLWQPSSHCPQCKKMPGMLFYLFSLGCSVSNSKKYASQACELFEPPAGTYESVRVVDAMETVRKETVSVTKSLKTQIASYRHEMDTIQTVREVHRAQFYRVDVAASASHVDKPFFEVIKCTSCCGGVVDFGGNSHCNTCDEEHCHECWKPRGAQHACSKSDLESVCAIKASSRQCPMCRTCIERSEGCPIMYCTQCRSGFNYDNGNRIAGLIDNPHFYEALFSGESHTSVYPSEGVSDPVSTHIFNNFTAEIAYKTHEAEDIVHRTIGRTIRFILDTPLVNLTLTRLRTLHMLVYEQMLKYICGDESIQEVVNTLRMIHQIESYVNRVESMTSVFMCLKSRVHLMEMIDEAIDVDKLHNLESLQGECMNMVTKLSAL